MDAVIVYKTKLPATKRITSMETPLRLAILTPSFNQGEYIRETICSIAQQDYSHKEHIVIDGGSTDETISILKEYPNVSWSTQKDDGQADALQKGFQRTAADVIGWINSDDFYEPQVFSSVMREFEDPTVQWVIGNLTYFYDQSGERVPDSSPAVSLHDLLRDPDRVRQQPAFFRRALLQEAGGWDKHFQMTMDLDLWIRCAKISRPKMVDKHWACFRIHAKQKTSRRNIHRQAREVLTILEREHAPGWVTLRFRASRGWLLLKMSLKQALIHLGLLDARFAVRPLRISKDR